MGWIHAYRKRVHRSSPIHHYVTCRDSESSWQLQLPRNDTISKHALMHCCCISLIALLRYPPRLCCFYFIASTITPHFNNSCMFFYSMFSMSNSVIHVHVNKWITCSACLLSAPSLFCSASLPALITPSQSLFPCTLACIASLLPIFPLHPSFSIQLCIC